MVEIPVETSVRPLAAIVPPERRRSRRGGRHDERVRAPSSEPLGQPIRGPRALDDSWPRFWHLAYNIARSEFKLKFFGSALGYLWQVMRPLLLFGVLYVFFVLVFHVDKAKGAAGHFYGAQLLGSIVLFTFFGEATSGAVRSVVDRENLVRKIQFPRLAIPVSVVLLALFNLGAEPGRGDDLRRDRGGAADAQLAGAAADHPDAGVLAHGRGDAALGAVRALPRHLADLGSVQPDPVLLLAGDPPRRNGARKSSRTARSITSSTTSTRSTHWSTIFQQFRHAMINHATLSAGQIMGSWAALLEPMAIVAAIFVLGFWYFNREAPHIAEDL